MRNIHFESGKPNENLGHQLSITTLLNLIGYNVTKKLDTVKSVSKESLKPRTFYNSRIGFMATPTPKVPSSSIDTISYKEGKPRLEFRPTDKTTVLYHNSMNQFINVSQQQQRHPQSQNQNQLHIQLPDIGNSINNSITNQIEGDQQNRNRSQSQFWIELQKNNMTINTTRSQAQEMYGMSPLKRNQLMSTSNLMQQNSQQKSQPNMQNDGKRMMHSASQGTFLPNLKQSPRQINQMNSSQLQQQQQIYSQQQQKCQLSQIDKIDQQAQRSNNLAIEYLRSTIKSKKKINKLYHEKLKNKDNKKYQINSKDDFLCNINKLIY